MTRFAIGAWSFTLMATGLLSMPRMDLNAQPSATPPVGWSWRPVDAVSGPLRILIIYDMEGLSGIDRPGMVNCDARKAYVEGQRRLVADVNAVVEGLALAGAKSIDVIDRHGSGCDDPPDLPPSRLDRRARFVDEQAKALIQRVTEREWDAIALVGGHASPGRQGFLEHTGSFGIERVINGVSVSESEQQALTFGSAGIPVIFASGDDRYGLQLRERMPWVTFAQVKRATSRVSAEVLTAQESREVLIAQAKAAVASRNRASCLITAAPLHGGVPTCLAKLAGMLGAIPGVDVSSGEIRVTGASRGEVNQALNRIATLVNSIFTSDAHWAEVDREGPNGLKRDRYRESLFMARWIAGPPAKKPPP